MPFFKKKPVIVEAAQRIGGSLQGGATRWVLDAIHKQSGHPGSLERVGKSLLVHKAGGADVIQEGDWVIKGANGELHPCEAVIFAKNFEPVS